MNIKITSLKNDFTQKLKEAKEANNENYQLLNTTLDNLKEEMDFSSMNLPNQCYNYKRLTSSERRFDHKSTVSNRKCDLTGRSYVASDWDGEGWYKVEGAAGYQLSEKYSSWKRDHCGFWGGGHLTGGHPALAG